MMEFTEKKNPLREKSYAFAVKIVHHTRTMINDQKEFVISKQLLKSGTSIGANIEEALQAQSQRDFLSKLSIALKEACETRYWLRLVRDTMQMPSKKIASLICDTEEIIKLLTAIIKTSKRKRE